MAVNTGRVDMSRNPGTCPHNIVDLDTEVSPNGEAITELEYYCTECGAVVENRTECCGAFIDDLGYCKECREHVV